MSNTDLAFSLSSEQPLDRRHHRAVTVDPGAQLHIQLEDVQREQRIQFERIAQMQAQLDQLLGILMKR
jgi:hypothetical protein